eukprot:6276986-Amphidinium_carterae.1
MNIWRRYFPNKVLKDFAAMILSASRYDAGSKRGSLLWDDGIILTVDAVRMLDHRPTVST